ncbi:unnamed protein product [Lepeophtheirus salmonis]|uniref:(salmon louse) hypothetical protein n=1 Tax=Lepeophtheirus salmonis TaxID=72036 RepID=A0A7R8H3Y9_LEPSM|nr:unnamed protein product [Lepeophtheirus salmonis]CAF2839281.1 unnamed protein product [Lepeophtheirus salmonis]
MQKEDNLTGDVNEEGSNDPCSQLLFRNPPPREWYKYPALEINPTNIQIWIHEQDVESLETVVYEGHGDLLLETSADNFKTLKFLEKVPKLMNDILEVHESAVTGDLNALVNKEYRTKIYSAKDKNGITAFHKAVALKQKKHLRIFHSENGKKSYGRRRDDKTMYYWLIDMGANSTEPDKYNITPQQALRKEVSPEIELHLCSELPDAPKLLPPTPSPKQSTVHLNNINLSSVKALECREFKKPESILALFGSSTKLIPLSKMTKENISKWVRVGNIGTLEQVVYAGRGQYLINKPAWNEETRKYLKNDTE